MMTRRPSTISLRRNAEVGCDRRPATESRLAKPSYLFDELEARDYSGRRSHWGTGRKNCWVWNQMSYRRVAHPREIGEAFRSALVRTLSSCVSPASR